MKKTLITLAALAAASVAQADIFSADGPLQFADWNISDDYGKETSPGSGTYTGPVYADSQFSGASSTTASTNDAFTLTLAIDWNKAVASGNGKTLVSVYGSNSDYFGNALKLTVDGTSLTISVNTDQSSTMSSRGEMTFSMDDYCVDGYLKLNYTFDGDKTFTLSALQNDAQRTLGTVQEFTGVESWLNNAYLPYFDEINIGKLHSDPWSNGFTGVDHLLVFNTNLTSTADLRAAANAVPEPATATLSLLALAGLAARRRRR